MARIPKYSDLSSGRGLPAYAPEEADGSFAEAIDDELLAKPFVDTSSDEHDAGGIDANSGDPFSPLGPDEPEISQDIARVLVHVYAASGRELDDASRLVADIYENRGPEALADKISIMVPDERPSNVSAQTFEKLGLPPNQANDTLQIYQAIAEDTNSEMVAWQGVWSLVLDGAEGEPNSGLTQDGYDGVDAALAEGLAQYGLNPSA